MILFDPNVHIFTIFALDDSEPLFVIRGHSVSQLFTIVLCYFIFELVEFRLDHLASVVVDGESTLDVGVAGDEVVEFRVDVVAPVVSPESLVAWSNVQSLFFVLLDIQHLSGQNLHFLRLPDVVWEHVDLDILALLDVDVGLLLVSRQNYFVMNPEVTFVVHNHSQVVGALHVVHASVDVVAHMRDLLLSDGRELLLPLCEIVGVEFQLLIF